MSPRILHTFAISVIAVASLTACSGTSPGTTPPATSAEAQGTTDISSCGIDLSFEKAPTHAVTVQQGATETMLTLGLADSMAGTSNLIGEIPETLQAAYDSVPVLAEDVLSSQEAMLAISPDFVYSTYGSMWSADQLGTREELKELGVPVYLSNADCQNSTAKPVPATFDEIFQEYRDIADIFGVQERAEKLIETQQEVLDAATEAAKSVTGEPTVLWLYSTYNGAPYVAGGNALASDINAITGTKNVFASVTDENWPEVSWEAIAQANPDIIVLADLSERGRPGDSAAEKQQLLESDPATQTLDAVKNKQFITVSGVPLDPSSRSIDSLNDFIAGLTALGYAS